MGKLVLFHADGTSQHIKLDRERVTVGRRRDNDVCLPRPAVSGEHAAVVTILADSFLEDLGSTNGTLVNGQAITKHFLRDRDVIDIGRELLVYLVDDLASCERPPSEEKPAAVTEGAATAAAANLAAGSANGSQQRDKRRSDSVPVFSGHSVEAIQRFVSAEIEGGPADPQDPSATVDSMSPGAVEPKLGQLQSVRVLSGTSMGRVVPLRRSETFVGRAGVQVAALRRSDDGIRVVPIEGGTPPNINGTPVAPDGQPFAVGDILEIAGSTLELVPPTDGDP